MRRALLGVVLLGLVSCGGGFDYGQFRETYVREATLGDEFAERPPELSDGQIDEAVRRVCGEDGKASLEVADEIADSLRVDRLSRSQLGSAIYLAVRRTACDPFPADIVEELDHAYED